MIRPAKMTGSIFEFTAVKAGNIAGLTTEENGHVLIALDGDTSVLIEGVREAEFDANASDYVDFS